MTLEVVGHARMCYNVVHQIEIKGCSMASSTITLRVDSAEKNLIADYAQTFGMSISEFIRSAVMDKIEDELDLRAWYEAKAEFDADPVVISADEIAKKYF